MERAGRRILGCPKATAPAPVFLKNNNNNIYLKYAYNITIKFIIISKNSGKLIKINKSLKLTLNTLK